MSRIIIELDEHSTVKEVQDLVKNIKHSCISKIIIDLSPDKPKLQKQVM